MKMLKLLLFVALGVPLAAQEAPLSLEEAVRQALQSHPALQAAQAREHAADARRLQARAGYQPGVQFQEAFQIGNNPVYVFSSKLTQRQFSASDFQIDNLVRPDPYRNFQTQLSAEQLLYDGGRAKNGVRAAEVGIKMSAEERRRLEMDVIAAVARAYHGVTLTQESLRVAQEGVKAAEADLRRAETMRDAGMATEADVLAVKVFLSEMQEQEIRRTSGLQVARAALNQAMGLPLDTAHKLTTPLTATLPPSAAPSAYESQAREQRPEVRIAGLAQSLAQVRGDEAKAGYLPQVFVRGILEADTRNFVTTGGGNWLFMGGLRWNVFDGSRTKNARGEARYLAESAAAEQRNAQSAVQLQARQSFSEWRSAQQRIGVTESSISMAAESLRIIRNRYSAGLANITEVLRAQIALLEAQTRRLAAVYDQRLAAVDLERAAGTLKGDSDVLR
jgi:outer membrane protein